MAMQKFEKMAETRSDFDFLMKRLKPEKHQEKIDQLSKKKQDALDKVQKEIQETKQERIDKLKMETEEKKKQL